VSGLDVKNMTSKLNCVYMGRLGRQAASSALNVCVRPKSNSAYRLQGFSLNVDFQLHCFPHADAGECMQGDRVVVSTGIMLIFLTIKLQLKGGLTPQ
jgi:hypothetical protein